MIYLLGLETNKFYVGYSKNYDSVAERIFCHIHGFGATWTKKYKPIRVMLVCGGSLDDERVLTLYLMRLYGVARVRGSYWTLTRDIKMPSMFYLYNLIERSSLKWGFNVPEKQEKRTGF